MPAPITFSAWIAGLALCLLAGAAVAQQPSQSQINAVKRSCRGDYQTNCAGMPPGAKALQCLQQHQDSLSVSCGAAVRAASVGGPPPSVPAGGGNPSGGPYGMGRGAYSQMTPQGETEYMRQACGADFRAYCPGMQPGSGRGLQCLRTNANNLSATCQSTLAEMDRRGSQTR